jgi:homeobox-leucine zipper protein
MVSSGLAFGAHRWVATLQRHCESLAILMVAAPSDDPTGIYITFLFYLKPMKHLT